MRNPALNFQTIVVATDLTQASSAALDYARLVARTYQARVVLAHVIDPMAYASVAGVPRSVLDQLTAAARIELERISGELLAAGIPSHSEIRQGVVAELLLQVIHQNKADLLILGTKGDAGAGPVALGSIAEELVRRATCPILTVAADVVPSLREAKSMGHVLVPVQRTTASIDVIGAAQSVAARFAGDLILLHVRTDEDISADISPAAVGMSFPVTQPRVPVRCLVRDGEPTVVIPETAEQYGVSLIVMGVNSESRHRATSPHGTVFHVIARAKVPVLLLPPSKPVEVRRSVIYEEEAVVC
jgi:nucleotide-binding universal stress UspA family protein